MLFYIVTLCIERAGTITYFSDINIKNDKCKRINIKKGIIVCEDIRGNFTVEGSLSTEETSGQGPFGRLCSILML